MSASVGFDAHPIWQKKPSLEPAMPFEQIDCLTARLMR
jgi:hypothetical protein